MKNYVSMNRLIQFLALLAVAGFFSVAQAQVSNLNVSLQMDGGQNRLEVTTRGQCSNNNHNGCLVVRQGTKARINFSFGGNKQCNRPGGVSWKVGEVYLGGKGSSRKPNHWGNLDSQVKADFSVADASSGRLNKDSGSNDNSIVIFNGNNSAYDIWYKVTAVCVDASGGVVDTIETDPRIKNEG